jgi:hypothetical protein
LPLWIHRRRRHRAGKSRSARRLGRSISGATAQTAKYQKSAFHRHFCNIANFLAAISLPKNFSAARFANQRDNHAVARGARHLHTILSGVTVIFFLL